MFTTTPAGMPTAPAHGIDSLWQQIPGAIDLEELEDQLAELPANYVRIKGIAYDGERGGTRSTASGFACPANP